VIGGPTASGKSGLALSIAERARGTIINADSMQLYAGLPLLTAQPSEDDKKRAPHKLYEALSPHETATAASWRAQALTEIDDALNDCRLPIVTGGTGFYIKALLEGLSPIPAIPTGIRATLSAKMEEIGIDAFFAELQKADPLTAAKIDRANPQRLIRAMEVLQGTGTPLSVWQAIPPEAPPAHLRFLTITLAPPRDTLYAFCDKRFDAMIQQGALDEAARFLHRPNHIPSPLDKALGYPELCRHLRHECTRDDAVTEAKAVTRHYAKRQTTWFRHQIRADLTLDQPDADAVWRCMSL
jgi:tRNA dimethylallyltransferase